MGFRANVSIRIAMKVKTRREEKRRKRRELWRCGKTSQVLASDLRCLHRNNRNNNISIDFSRYIILHIAISLFEQMQDALSFVSQ